LVKHRIWGATENATRRQLPSRPRHWAKLAYLRQNLPGEWANNSTFKKRYRQKIQKIPGFFWFTPEQCLVNKYEGASMVRTR
jgi:hypothetical protein